MSRTFDIIRGALMLLIILGLIGWWMYRSLRSTEDPTRLIIKWVITALMVPGFFFILTAGVYAAPFAAVIGLILAITWGRSIGGLIAKPFENLFTGGDTPADPQPFYSIAQAQRKKGQFREAVSSIQQQLQKFPNDATGQMMLAEIQAENLNDLPGAQLTVERFCQQTGHAPESIAIALHQLADWHLKFGQDLPAAQQTLEKIIELLPGSEQSRMASQRIAHLGTSENLFASHDRQAIRLRAGVDNIGLLKDSSSLQKAAEDPALQAAACIKHLEAHPLDSEAREKLALIYAEHYHRLDLATDQLEQLIQQPNQPAKQQVHLLNLLARLHVQHGDDYESARGALQRIIDFYAGSALAALAEQRLAHLKLDFKGKEQGQSVKLGTYEKNVGLKKPPRPR